MKKIICCLKENWWVITMIELLICALVMICVLMLCFIIFMLGRVFENTIIIRELEEKIEMFNSEFFKIIESVGEDK